MVYVRNFFFVISGHIFCVIIKNDFCEKKVLLADCKSVCNSDLL